MPAAGSVGADLPAHLEPLVTLQCVGPVGVDAIDQGVARAFVTQDPRELLVYFSQPVDPELLNTDVISLESPGGSVDIDLRYNAEENRLRIIPLAPLDDQLTYTLGLDRDITDLDGARLGAGRGEQLTFTPDEERIR